MDFPEDSSKYPSSLVSDVLHSPLVVYQKPGSAGPPPAANNASQPSAHSAAGSAAVGPSLSSSTGIGSETSSEDLSFCGNSDAAAAAAAAAAANNLQFGYLQNCKSEDSK